MAQGEELKRIYELLQKMQQVELSVSDYQKLQYLLMKNESFFRNGYPMMKTNITGDKIMYISDTHIGGQDEMPHSLVAAYDIALRKNIKTVIHAGDLIEVCANNQFDKGFDIVQEELHQALQYMPDEITTKLLLGNHDYSAIRTFPSIIPQFFSHAKLEILGMQRVLLNWDNIAMIRLNHPIKQLRHEDNEECGVIQISGHYHTYSVDETTKEILLPPICKDEIDHQKAILLQYGLTLAAKSKPTFVISSKQEDVILFKSYCIDRENGSVEQANEEISINVKTRQIKKY